MNADKDVKKQLLGKLKKENCFWSYDVSKMKAISDDSLIEYVLLYLDIDDVNKLFPLFGYKKVKSVWLHWGKCSGRSTFCMRGTILEQNARKHTSRA